MSEAPDFIGHRPGIFGGNTTKALGITNREGAGTCHLVRLQAWESLKGWELKHALSRSGYRDWYGPVGRF